MSDISTTFTKFQKRLAKNYVIIYKYFEENDDIIISHIFHQTQDYGKIFQTP